MVCSKYDRSTEKLVDEILYAELGLINNTRDSQFELNLKSVEKKGLFKSSEMRSPLHHNLHSTIISLNYSPEQLRS